jgi:hypothetical protein
MVRGSAPATEHYKARLSVHKRVWLPAKEGAMDINTIIFGFVIAALLVGGVIVYKKGQ